jgi:hypothetical protein
MGIRDELVAIQQKDENHVLHAAKAVAWAKAHPESYLYRSLEWNDDVAAHEYRLEQVRKLIRLHVIDERGDPIVVSLSIDRPNGGGYRAMDDVLSTPDLRAIMLRDALAELDRVRKRYNSVKELAEVWEATEKVKSRSRKARTPETV